MEKIKLSKTPTTHFVAKVYSNDEYAETPEYVYFTIDKEDLRRIQKAQAILTDKNNEDLFSYNGAMELDCFITCEFVPGYDELDNIMENADGLSFIEPPPEKYFTELEESSNYRLECYSVKLYKDHFYLTAYLKNTRVFIETPALYVNTLLYQQKRLYFG